MIGLGMPEEPKPTKCQDCKKPLEPEKGDGAIVCKDCRIARRTRGQPKS